jgi:HAD superfamily hydrolase (TIGR01509 family)
MAASLEFTRMPTPKASDFDAFIFDLDNTLIASEPYHLQAFAQAMRELAGYELSAQDAKDYLGDSSAALASKIIKRLGLKLCPQQVAARKSEYCQAIFKAEPYPGACDFVRQHARHKRLAIASNSPQCFVEQALRELKLLSCLDAVVSGEEVRERKPNPEIFHLAARRLGVPRERCLVFEDSHIGLQAALAAKFPAVLVLNPGNPLPEIIPDEFLTMTWPQLQRWAAAD